MTRSSSSRPSPPSRSRIPLAVVKELDRILADFDRAETDGAERIRQAHPTCRASAINLLHYLAFRRRDLRRLQDRLSTLGLSSLGRAEADVRASVQAVRDMLAAAISPSHRKSDHGPALFEPGSRRVGRALLQRHAAALLGPPPPPPRGRSVRILVTMPSEAAHDPALVAALRSAGMDLARINCAHDSPDDWQRMAQHINPPRAPAPTRAGSRHRTAIVMDLPGPKVRTGAIEPGPPVLKIRPVRDLLGRVRAPAEVWLVPEGSSPAHARVRLPVQPASLAPIRRGDLVAFTDARGSRRSMRVVAARGRGPARTVRCELTRTAYVLSGTRITVRRAPAAPRPARALSPAPRAPLVSVSHVGSLPHLPGEITLRPGDRLLLRRDTAPGRVGSRGPDGRQLVIPSIPCTLPGALNALRPRHRVLFDDGKIAGVVESIRTQPARRSAERAPAAEQGQGVLIRITAARAEGSRLRADKGINFPDSPLRVPALTPEDLHCLPVVVRLADAVCYSFVRRESDVRRLHLELDRLARPDMPVILKIENREAFEHLPALLLEGMRRPHLGVMIARGDLAVELGYERLAEVQEEILWLCEAAHVPVIWATQVLESLASRGQPSRAEVTDAAMSQRAECVMLNKGPFVEAACRTLDDILRRMHGHQSKKISRLRRLSVAHLRGVTDRRKVPHKYPSFA